MPPVVVRLFGLLHPPGRHQTSTAAAMWSWLISLPGLPCPFVERTFSFLRRQRPARILRQESGRLRRWRCTAMLHPDFWVRRRLPFGAWASRPPICRLWSDAARAGQGPWRPRLGCDGIFLQTKCQNEEYPAPGIRGMCPSTIRTLRPSIGFAPACWTSCTYELLPERWANLSSWIR